MRNEINGDKKLWRFRRGGKINDRLGRVRMRMTEDEVKMVYEQNVVGLRKLINIKMTAKDIISTA